jgi:hypothetical protein
VRVLNITQVRSAVFFEKQTAYRQSQMAVKILFPRIGAAIPGERTWCMGEALTGT